MNTQIRRLGVGLLACYVALFAMLNWVQVLQADTYNDNPLNTARIRRDFNRPRGSIISADGAVLATSIDNPDTESQFERIRTYPEADLFAQVTGYFSFWYGSTGVEREYNAELSGQTFEQQLRGFGDLFVEQENVGDVTVSVRKDLQEVARDALGDRQGSVVALDVKTGELLSFWSYPSFDPNLLTALDFDQVEQAWALLNLAPDQPLRAHQFQERYFPGSTFKVVTGSTGVQTGKVTPEQPDYPVERSWTPPQTNVPISNFGGSLCGGTLFEILARSCNTSFARMGVETIGPDDMVAGAEAFGFNETPPIDLPGAVSSVFPTDFTQDLPKLAQSSIGQNDVQASPLRDGAGRRRCRQRWPDHAAPRDGRDPRPAAGGGRAVRAERLEGAAQRGARPHDAPGHDRGGQRRHRVGAGHSRLRSRWQDRHRTARHRPRRARTRGSSASVARPEIRRWRWPRWCSTSRAPASSPAARSPRRWPGRCSKRRCG